MATKNLPIENRILASLPRREYRRLHPHLKRVALGEAQILYAAGETDPFVYFPNDSIVSMLYGLNDYPVLVLAAVGREGMVGIPLTLKRPAGLPSAVVQHAGSAMKIKAGTLRKNMTPGDPLRRLLFRYTHARLAQVTQSVACDRFHTVEARLASWLLVTQDRMRSDEFQRTQESMAGALRIRRERINTAAGSLQRRKLIDYSRGLVRILDRQGLEAAACPCYAIDKQSYDDFLCP
ncbi:MAG: Crp/Fnr family transcriptional regulator [Gammaproteobacteria bacterium]